jgi:autotransporter-associated beta strand protein
VVVLSGRNSYSGGTNVTEGTLVLGVDNTLLSTGSVSVFGGELALGLTMQTTGAVTLSGGVISGGSLTGTGYTVESGSIGSVLSGALVALSKNTGGTVILSGSNQYGGGTVVNEGTLRLGASERLLDAGALTLNGGVLDLGGNSETVGLLTLHGGAVVNGFLRATAFNLEQGVVTSALTGSAGVVKTTDGVVDLLSVNDYSGGTEIRAGRLRLGGNERLLATGSLIVSGGTFDLNTYRQTVGSFQLIAGTVQSGSLSASSFGLESGLVSAVLGGTATLTKSTGGTVVLSGANDLSGLMVVNAGSLVIANAGLLTRGALTVDGTGAVLDLGATAQSVSAFQLSAGTVQSGSLTASSFGLESGLVSAVLGGTATLTKSTSGTVVLSGTNDLSGLMEINAGSLVVANAGLLTRGALTVDGTGAVLDLGATEQRVSAFRLAAGTVQSGSLTASSFGLESGLVSAVLGGTATLTKSTGGTVVLSGANDLSGLMVVNAGSLVIADAGLLTRGALTVDGTGAVLDLGATEQSVSAFRLSAGTVQSGSLSASSFGLESGLVSAALGGAATLTKSTGGTVVLSGANDLSGLMVVNAGSLVITNAGLLTRGALTVDGTGAVLDLGATAQSVSAFQLIAGTVQSGSLSASSFGLESGLVSAVLGGTATLTKSTGGTVVLSGAERPERIDGG